MEKRLPGEECWRNGRRKGEDGRLLKGGKVKGRERTKRGEGKGGKVMKIVSER